MNQYPGQNPYAAPQAPVVNAGQGYGQVPYGAPDVRAEGKLLVAANGSPLPAMCLKCGAPPNHWKPQKYMYVPPMARLIGWLGILIFGKKSSFQLPLCNGHLAEWKKWNLFAWMSTLPPFVLWCVAIATLGLDSDTGSFVFFAGMLLIIADLVIVLVIRSKKIVMATKIDKTHSWLNGVHPTVLQFVSNSPVAQGYAQPAYAQPQVPPQGGYGPPPGGGYGGPPPQGWPR